jgi:peptide/nickel transport system permease protein
MVARVNETQPRKAGAGLPTWLRRIALLRESPVGIVGAGLVTFWVVMAIFAPWLAPYAPNANDFEAQGKWLPSAVYLAGCVMGLLAGYYRGWVDGLVSRISDIILSFPVIILYMIIIANFGPSAFNIIVAVTFTAAPQITRIVRGLTLELRERDYVAAAKMRGEGAWYIMLVEILPNARGPLIVDACLRMGYTTIAIGVLGFLGLGLPPPDPDWGGMVRETYVWVSTYPHMSIIPCLAISSLVVGFNMLSDGIREIGLRD